MHLIALFVICGFSLKDQPTSAMRTWAWILTIFVTDTTRRSTFISGSSRLNSCLEVISSWQKAIIIVNLNLILIYVGINVSQLLFRSAFFYFFIEIIDIFRQLELRYFVYEAWVLKLSVVVGSGF